MKGTVRFSIALLLLFFFTVDPLFAKSVSFDVANFAWVSVMVFGE